MADNKKLPFAEIAAAALKQSESLLAEWLPDGRRSESGIEWIALNPTRADGKPGSFSINIATGKWSDFATDDAGGDLVSLYAYLFHHGAQGPAAIEMATRFGITLPPLEKERRVERKTATAKPAEPQQKPPESKKPRTWWKPLRPVPDNAPEPPRAHWKCGLPSRVATYREADGRTIGYVYRFITSDGEKDDIPLVYARHEKLGKCEWRWMAFSEDRRPLYGLDRAAAKPDATLIFTEGEKCADVAHEALSELASMSWAGGCGAVRKADIEALADRTVKKAVLWPDCDAQREKLTKLEKEQGVDPNSKPLRPAEQQPGIKAMLSLAVRLHAIGFKVWILDIPPPGEKPPGWDIADAVAEGFTAITLADYVREKARPWRPPETDNEQHSNSAEPPSPTTEAGAGQEWECDLVRKRGELAVCTHNVALILMNSLEWKGVLGYDEFEKKTVKLKPPPTFGSGIGDWDDTDDTWTSMWLASCYGFTPTSQIVSEAVEAVAKRAYRFHPVRDYLNGLTWDGVVRLDHWLADFMGVDQSEYSRRVGAWFFLALIDRAMNPGQQFKYCLILEGEQDAGKSKALRIIGSPWYGDTDMDLHNKDSMVAIQGKWIYEFPELDTVSRAESSRTKSFLSRQVDEFRPHYGRRMIKCARQTVFAGSVNEFCDYMKDPTGAVRFWPVLCKEEINHKGLAAVKDQLFAEALVRWKNKERFWPTREEQKELFTPQQIKREFQDGLVDAIHDWVFARTADFSLFDVVADCLKLDASKLTRDLQTRLGICIRKLGCQRVERRNGMIRYWYKPPVRNGASSMSGMPAQQAYEGDHVPF